MVDLSVTQLMVMPTVVISAVGLVIGFVGMVYSVIYELRYSSRCTAAMPLSMWLFFAMAAVTGFTFGFSYTCLDDFGPVCRAVFL